jgi:transcriptional regulator with XRE-family HTH domain
MSHNAVSINGTALKDARLRMGWSLRALSDATADAGQRVDFSNISRYERGTLQPFPRTLKAMADALGVTVDDLRAGEDAAA